jgi:hypothetical protein
MKFLFLTSLLSFFIIFLTEEHFLLIPVHCARKYRGHRGSNPWWQD